MMHCDLVCTPVSVYSEFVVDESTRQRLDSIAMRSFRSLIVRS